METLAAVLGGCDDVTCSPLLDPASELALGLPLGSATQLLLREEASLRRIADPAGGSWYVEALTAALARRGWERLVEGIERRDGVTRELARGCRGAAGGRGGRAPPAGARQRPLPIVGVTVHAADEAVPLPYRPLAKEDTHAGLGGRRVEQAANSTPQLRRGPISRWRCSPAP